MRITSNQPKPEPVYWQLELTADEMADLLAVVNRSEITVNQNQRVFAQFYEQLPKQSYEWLRARGEDLFLERG